MKFEEFQEFCKRVSEEKVFKQTNCFQFKHVYLDIEIRKYLPKENQEFLEIIYYCNMKNNAFCQKYKVLS